MVYCLYMLKRTRTVFLIIFGGIFLVLVFVVPIASFFVSASSCDDTDTSCINDQISSLEKKLKDASKKKDALQQNLNQINTSLTSTQQIIQRTQVLLNESTQTIGQKEQEIANLEQQLILEKEVLKGLVRELYAVSDIPLPEIILTENNVLSLFQENDSLLLTQEKMQGVIGDISDMRGKVAGEKSSLEDMKKDQELLLSLKNKQKQSLIVNQIDTQGNLEDQQATISELNDKLAELRKDLSDFLGESITAKDIQDAAKIASDATGVRKDFILGELVVETNLGRFTGGCKYKDTKMHSYDIPIFKEIMKSLKYDLNEKKISCAPKSGGYGGAMGVAQFIPSTWSGWQSKIAAKTGHNPPDPWSITDGVMGMALKLAAGGATSKGGEKAASMIYYCGTSKPKETYKGRVAACNNYAARVQYWANNYESKL